MPGFCYQEFDVCSLVDFHVYSSAHRGVLAQKSPFLLLVEWFMENVGPSTVLFQGKWALGSGWGRQTPCKAAWHLTPSVESMSKARIKCLLLNSTGWHSALVHVLCQQHTMAGKAGCSMLTVHQTRLEEILTRISHFLLGTSQQGHTKIINYKNKYKAISQANVAHPGLGFSFWMRTNKFE